MCVLKGYLITPTPPSGTMARGTLQFLLNAAAEYVPAYVERMYWMEQETMTSVAANNRQPPVKLYLKSFMVGLSVFLEDLSMVIKQLPKGGKRSEDSVANGLLQCLKRRSLVSVFADPSPGAVRLAKVNRVKTLYGARMRVAFGSDLSWQGGLWTQSIVRAISPLLVTVLEHYASPYNISVLLNRMLDLLLENTRQLADPADVKAVNGRDKTTNNPESFNQIKYKKLNDPAAERLSQEYGKLINSITSSILDMVEISGVFRVLAAVAKPLRTLFQQSIGAALSVALESTIDEDLRKVNFAMTLLFGKEVASSVHINADDEPEDVVDELLASGIEDLLSSQFDKLPEISDIEARLEFAQGQESRDAALKEFYDGACVSKLEELILLQLSRKSSTVAKLSGDYIKQLLKSLNDSVGLALRSERILDMLIWDYLICFLL